MNNKRVIELSLPIRCQLFCLLTFLIESILSIYDPQCKQIKVNHINPPKHNIINAKFSNGCRPLCLAVFVGVVLYFFPHSLPHTLSGSGSLVFAFKSNASACPLFEHAREIGVEFFTQLGHAIPRAIGVGRLVPASDGVARTQLVHSHHASIFYEPGHWQNGLDQPLPAASFRVAASMASVSTTI